MTILIRTSVAYSEFRMHRLPRRSFISLYSFLLHTCLREYKVASPYRVPYQCCLLLRTDDCLDYRYIYFSLDSSSSAAFEGSTWLFTADESRFLYVTILAYVHVTRIRTYDWKLDLRGENMVSQVPSMHLGWSPTLSAGVQGIWQSRAYSFAPLLAPWPWVQLLPESSIRYVLNPTYLPTTGRPHS